MKKIFSFLVLLLAGHTLQAQDSTRLPQEFIGTWKGTLQWLVAGKAPVTYSTRLTIHPADTAGQYTWTIAYGDDGKDNRPYLLKPVDPALGHWVVDEGDGIVLDSYIHGNSIHGAFTVGEATLVDNYKVEGDKMFVEFFTIKLKEKKTSGKGTADTPFVDSYKIANYHTGVLIKVN